MLVSMVNVGVGLSPADCLASSLSASFMLDGVVGVAGWDDDDVEDGFKPARLLPRLDKADDDEVDIDLVQFDMGDVATASVCSLNAVMVVVGTPSVLLLSDD